MSPSETQTTPEPNRRAGIPLPRVLGLLVFAVLLGLLAPLAYRYVDYRAGHSITDDAFVEAQMVHVAPDGVSGRIVVMATRENDFVKKGQVLLELDPETYEDQVAMARAKLEMALAEKKRQEIGLEKLRKEIPLTVEMSRKSLELALAEQAKMASVVRLTEDEVTGTIQESDALVGVAQANRALAQQEFDRFSALYQENAVTLRRAQEVTRNNEATKAELRLAETKQLKARSLRSQVVVAQRDLDAASAAVEKARVTVALAETGRETIREAEEMLRLREQAVAEARTLLHTAEHHLKNTRLTSPVDGIVVKRQKNTGDHITMGIPVITLFDPEVLFVTANMEETRLQGIAPGCTAEIHVDATGKTHRGKVLWINRSTGAEFSLLPRNVVTGEFTKVVQRVPIRIVLDKDQDLSSLRAGFSVRVIIAHGPGDKDWANQALVDFASKDSRFDEPKENSQETVEPKGRKQ